jgi:hypothetical protein
MSGLIDIFIVHLRRRAELGKVVHLAPKGIGGVLSFLGHSSRARCACSGVCDRQAGVLFIFNFLLIVLVEVYDRRRSAILWSLASSAVET